jgi:signal transduction histidine kinase
MGNGGKTAVGAFVAALGMLALTAITLEEAVLFTFLGLVAVGYVASVAEAFARRRYLALLAGAAATSLFIGCAIAFLRMWGLAFNQDPAALGAAVTTQDSDIYFYLAAASASLALLVLFAAAVWPARRRTPGRSRTPARKRRPTAASASRRSSSQRQPAQRQPAARQPAPRQPAQRSASPRRAAASRPSAGRTRR